MTEEDDDTQDYKKPWVGLTDEEIEVAYGITIKIRKKGKQVAKHVQVKRPVVRKYHL